MEALGTPESRPPPWYHFHPPPTYFGMDAWRAPHGIHQPASRRRPTRSCGYPAVMFDPILTLATSYPISPKAFTFSTPAIYFMVISREYVICSKPHFIFFFFTHVQSTILVDSTCHARIPLAMVMIEVRHRSSYAELLLIVVPYKCSYLLARFRSTLTEGLWSLMQCCWNHDPRLRPEVPEVLQILLTESVSLIPAVTHSSI